MDQTLNTQLNQTQGNQGFGSLQTNLGNMIGNNLQKSFNKQPEVRLEPLLTMRTYAEMKFINTRGECAMRVTEMGSGDSPSYNSTFELILRKWHEDELLQSAV